METCDILIVGGGPAGSSCAWRLRDSGLNVVVMDQATFPRDKLCAGWVTPSVFSRLQIDPSEYSSGRILQPIHGFRTGLIGGPSVTTMYDSVVSYAIRRCEFDDFLLRRSRARLRLGEAARLLTRSPDGWIVNDNLKSPMLVGAGGHFCPVANHVIGANRPKSNIVASQEVEFKLPADACDQCAVEPNVPELFFSSDLKGYGWCVRKGNYLNIGLGRLDRGRLSQHVDEFRQFLRESGRLPFDIPSRWRGHAYRVCQSVPNPVHDGCLVIGDALGLADPRSGEGIRPAVESGLAAAEAVIRASGLFNREQLASFESLLRVRLGRSRGHSPSDRLPHCLTRMVASALLRNGSFVRHVLLNRWFLHG